MHYRSVVNFVAFFLITYLCTSCIDTRKSTYFNDLPETVLLSSNYDTAQHVIERNDLLSIRISSPNEEASRPFNVTNASSANVSTAAGGKIESVGYLVNSEGYVQLPLLGFIKAAGYNKEQLKDYITKLLLDKKLLVEPIVDIRHLNYEVTVIGEVTKPTVITVPSEKISLVKALGIAGDITVFGRKDNVLLIREVEGKKIVKRLDLNSPTFLQSPYYYLQPNDVVYVEATKNKEANVSRNRIILPSVLSGLSVLIILIDRITR
jgi:polysaccharide biosynthesis/export protein